MNPPALQSVQLKNFKAIQDSGILKLTPLTAFIGYNGSGKSSFVEGLETLQTIVEQDLDDAMNQWRGFEHIWNQARNRQLRSVPARRREPLAHYRPRACQTHPMMFRLRGRLKRGRFRSVTELSAGPGENEIFIKNEQIFINNVLDWNRDIWGNVQVKGRDSFLDHPKVSDGESILGRGLDGYISEWQFLSLVAQRMGAPTPQKRTGGPTRLAKDGSNIAQYLQSIRDIDLSVFDSILETLQYVLPYASDLQPTLTSELERAVYLQMAEGQFKVPGWLLSTGTLRLLALLAVLRHPPPPPLIVIEEIENGLDPRTIHLIVDEIRQVVESGHSQVIITTHSPYLLDLLDLSHIVLVERTEDGIPVFTRPADETSLQQWAKSYGPGKLYTMNRLGRHK